MEDGRALRISDRRALHTRPPHTFPNLLSGCTQRAATRIPFRGAPGRTPAGPRDTVLRHFLQRQLGTRLPRSRAQTCRSDGHTLGVVLPVSVTGSVIEPRDGPATICPQSSALAPAPRGVGYAAPSSNHSIQGKRTVVDEPGPRAGDDFQQRGKDVRVRNSLMPGD